MADQFNVKRHQLRRALQVLRDAGELGPIETRRKSIDARQSEALARDTNPVEVIEIRLALEPSLARLAAVRASSLDISRILKTASTSVKSDSGSADLAFHRSIAAATGNRLAQRALLPFASSRKQYESANAAKKSRMPRQNKAT